MAVLVFNLTGVFLLPACAEIKETGRTVGHTTRNVTREIGHGTRDITRTIGHNTRAVVHDIGASARKAVSVIGNGTLTALHSATSNGR